MSDQQQTKDTRATRIARYKEERRKQLAEQFRHVTETTSSSSPNAPLYNISTSESRNGNSSSNSSNSDGPRTTRTSRLRAQARLNQHNGASGTSGSSPLSKIEKNIHSPQSDNSKTLKADRDKSNRRKSNLNRNLASEEIAIVGDDPKITRRRRRFFPQEILNQTPKPSKCVTTESCRSPNNTVNNFCPTSQNTASSTSPSFTLPTTLTSTSLNLSTPPRITSKRSELSIHMENARRGVLSPSGLTNTPKYKTFMSTATSKKTSVNTPMTEKRVSSSFSQSDKETGSRATARRLPVTSVSDNESGKNIAKRMEELTAFTRETLAKVERLAHRTKDLPVKKTPVKNESKQINDDHSVTTPASILKRKSKEEKENATGVVAPPVKDSGLQMLVQAHGPVSILKRKIGQDDKTEPHSTHTPPVTFSPNVVEPSTTNRRQGILKKRRSLDESTVMRHRSCSPDVANKTSDSKSILKNQRRSSLEELRRTQSPEVHIHGILKRKTKNEEDDHSLNSPQGILKRRSGASSAGSTSSTPHVSITTAVILAAAGGAEIILEPETQQDTKEPVKPILKKKSFSEEYSYSESSSDAPKPILKKKSSTDTDEGGSEEKPMKPILKLPRNSLEKEILDTGQDNGKYLRYSNGGECEDVKPILKSISIRGDSPRPRLSFSGDRKSSHLNHKINEDSATNNNNNKDTWQSRRNSRRSYTICSDLNVGSNAIGRCRDREDDHDLKKARPLSVLELIRTFEKNGEAKSTGAIPKRPNWKRGSDRYRTQPVTYNELEESRKILTNSQNTGAASNQLEGHSLRLSRLSSSQVHHQNLSISSRSLDRGMFDLTSPLDDDTHLTGFLISPFLSSTFQTIGVSNPESPTCHKTSSDSAFQSLGDGLELEEEELQEKLEKISINTEPMSLASQMRSLAEEAKKKRLERDLNVTERRGILKSSHIAAKEGSLADAVSSTSVLPRRNESFSSSRSTSKKPDNSLPQPPPPPLPQVSLDLGPSNADFESDSKILKSIRLETSQDKDDEGISCNDSGSDSEASMSKCKTTGSGGVGDDDAATTSEGESSGGREVQQILRNNNNNDNKLNNFRKHLEGVLSKSKSHTSFNPRNSGSASYDVRHHHGMTSSVSSRPLPTTACDTNISNLDRLSPPTSTTTVNLRRSHTHTAGTMPRTIADLRAKLQENGETGWLKRVPLNNNSCDELKLLQKKNRYNDELSEKSILSARKDQLDAASKQWKNRVEKSDAEKFSVAGKMAEKIEDVNISTSDIPINIDKQKKTPQAKRFKGKYSTGDSSSTPTSPEKTFTHFDLTRSKSALSPIITSGVQRGDSTDINGTPIQVKCRRVVSIPKPDDYTFTTFFESVEKTPKSSSNQQSNNINAKDFDAVERQSLLILKKNVQVRKRKVATRNPIKALATRNDISDEYTEIITGVAEREKKRLNIEKLAQNSNKALEALAGLASNEDFKSIALKKGVDTQVSLQPWKQLMLLQIKGRRHVQTRLVAPTANSINEGDCFILVTPTELYNYTGEFSNVIEQSRAADVANHIQKTGDLGCKVTKILNISSKDVSKPHLATFWKLLGSKEAISGQEIHVAAAGHSTEDEGFETDILHTNMIYTLDNNELVPYDNYWGTLPKIQMLTETNVIVFDFGSEMYVWSGKNAPIDRKRLALDLAKQLWDEGFNYSDCSVNPLNVASMLGERNDDTAAPLKGSERPTWALFAKITQHRETILFKEKFLDWPDFSRVIKVRGDNDNGRRRSTGSIEIKPCNVNEMIRAKGTNPDLLVGNNVHLGRGDQYFDEETRRLFEYDTLEIKAWRILENNHEQLDEKSIGQFYDGDSYIYNWKFRQTVKGRELNGKPSKYSQAGREMSIFFCWHGNNSSISEKCTAAFLTVELDKQNAPQVRVVQGSEPAAFLQLFNGAMVIHRGKRDEELREKQNKSRLFIVRGEIENETYLMEVSLEMSSLRSRSSFVLVDDEQKNVMCWHGCKSSKQKRKVTKAAVEKILNKQPLELFSIDNDDDDEEEEKEINILEMDEGSECKEFSDIIKINRESYHSLLNNENNEYNYTPRLYKMSSVTGNFIGTEILCPHRSEHCSPYPFVQSELYSGSQPGLVLFDNYHELWLWQGWWPEKDDDNELNADQTGSGAIRWQAERRAAMQTAVKYWKKIHHHNGEKSENAQEKEIVAYLVWAGCEPLEFRNLFPTWIVRKDVKELNLKDGKHEDDKINLLVELALLSRTTYPLEEILQRPLPEGVDPTQLEIYLSDKDFKELLHLTKEEFELLPSWRKTTLKKEKGLF